MPAQAIVVDRFGNPIDDDEIVPDGGTLRVKLMLMDHLLPEVRQALARSPALRKAFGLQDSSVVHDGMGNVGGHKPGYAFGGGVMVGEVMRATRARDEYVKGLTDAWRNAGPTHTAPTDKRDTKPTPKPAPQLTGQQAWEQYVDKLSNAWRTAR